MVLARIHNVRNLSDWDSGIDHLAVIRSEHIPLVVLCQRQWTFFEFFGCVVIFVGLASKDSGQYIVSLLDFAHYDRLEFAAGCLEVEISLAG
jgi:hypothetical protein